MVWLLLGSLLLLLVGGAWLDNKERETNPEEWARKREESHKKWKEEVESEYKEAMQRVPASKWMLMSRKEKARVLERRERATEIRRNT